MSSETSGRSVEDQFFSTLRVHFNHIHAIDPVFLEHIIERFQNHFFANAVEGGVAAQ